MANLSLTNDYIFRSIFSAVQNEDILLSLVNAVLQSKRLQPLIHIRPANPFLPVQQQAQREGILDVHAYDESGKQYDLEIQVRSQRSYVKRSLYYLARMYGSQLVKSIDYDRLEPCVSINLLDFILFPESSDFHHFYTFCEFDHRERELSPEMTVHYLEIPKLIEVIPSGQFSGDRSLNLIDKWLYLIKEIDNPEDAMVQTIIRETPELDRVKKEYDQFMTDDQRKWEAESHDKWLHDQAQYRLEAMQDGRAEGLAEGQLLALQNTARKMLEKGLDIPQIVDFTGLSPEAVSQLK